MTIEQYLQGKVDYELSSTTIASILYDRGIGEGTQMSFIADIQRDLALADVYMFLANSSTTSSGGSESDGGWSRTNACKNVSTKNRSAYLALAKALYGKWNVEVPSIVSVLTSKPLYK